MKLKNIKQKLTLNSVEATRNGSEITKLFSTEEQTGPKPLFALICCVLISFYLSKPDMILYIDNFLN